MLSVEAINHLGWARAIFKVEKEMYQKSIELAPQANIEMQEYSRWNNKLKLFFPGGRNF